ncbi:hypothetical protein GCM10027427_15520 [Pseudoclavibacter terrae]
MQRRGVALAAPTVLRVLVVLCHDVPGSSLITDSHPFSLPAGEGEGSEVEIPSAAGEVASDGAPAVLLCSAAREGASERNG